MVEGLTTGLYVFSERRLPWQFLTLLASLVAKIESKNKTCLCFLGGVKGESLVQNSLRAVLRSRGILVRGSAGGPELVKSKFIKRVEKFIFFTSCYC
jgi:hypothetical protein